MHYSDPLNESELNDIFWLVKEVVSQPYVERPIANCCMDLSQEKKSL